MEKIISFVGITLSFVAFATTFIETSVTSNVSATIVTPVSISKDNDMDFANVAN